MNTQCGIMIFEWDDTKNALNTLKHGLSFEEAIQIFKGNFEITYDKDHSTIYEDRFWAIGKIKTHGIIVVVYSERIENVIRIISARKATRVEIVKYEKT